MTTSRATSTCDNSHRGRSRKRALATTQGYERTSRAVAFRRAARSVPEGGRDAALGGRRQRGSATACAGPLRELAHARLGDLLHEDHVVGQPPLGDAAVEEGEDLVSRRLLALAQHHARERALAPLGVRQADHRGLGHRRVRHDLVLELDRADPLAARLDHVLGAVAQLDVAVRIDGGDIAGLQPPVVGERLGGPLVVVVGRRDPRAAHLQLTRRLAVPRLLLGRARLHDARLDPEQRLAHRGAQVGLGRRRARRRGST